MSQAARRGCGEEGQSEGFGLHSELAPHPPPKLGVSQVNLGLQRTPWYLLGSGFDLPVGESFLQDGQVSTQELQGEKYLHSEHSHRSLFK